MDTPVRQEIFAAHAGDIRRCQSKIHRGIFYASQTRLGQVKLIFRFTSQRSPH